MVEIRLRHLFASFLGLMLLGFLTFSTLPLWISHALSLVSLGESLSLSKVSWQSPTSLLIETVIIKSESAEVEARDVSITWLHPGSFALSDGEIRIAHAQLKNINTAQTPDDGQPRIQLPDMGLLPSVVINDITIAPALLAKWGPRTPSNLAFSVRLAPTSSSPLELSIFNNRTQLGEVDIAWHKNALELDADINTNDTYQWLRPLLVQATAGRPMPTLAIDNSSRVKGSIDLQTLEANLFIQVPPGHIRAAEGRLSWPDALSATLSATPSQWRVDVEDWTLGHLELDPDVISQLPLPEFISSVPLLQPIDLQLNNLTFDQNTLASGSVNLTGQGIALELKDLLASSSRQQSDFKLTLSNSALLPDIPEHQLTLSGDISRESAIAVRLRTEAHFPNIAHSGVSCSNVSVSAPKGLEATLSAAPSGIDDISALAGSVSVSASQCGVFDKEMHQLDAVLNITNAQQVHAELRWQDRLRAEADIAYQQDRLQLTIKGQSNQLHKLQSTFFPVNDVTLSQGTLAFEGKLNTPSTDLESIKGSWSLTASTQGQYQDMQANGISVSAKGTIKDLAVAISPGSELVIQETNVGVIISDLKAELLGQLAKDRVDIQIADLRGKVLGGTLHLDTLHLTPEPAGDARLSLKSIALSQLVELQSQPGIELQGSVSGQLPIHFDSSGIHIRGGEFQSEAPGLIKVKDNPAVQNLKSTSEQTAQAMTLLEHLIYDELASDVSFTPEGDLTLAVRIKGKNPELGREIHFNYTHEENLYQLLQSLRLGDELAEQIEQQYQDNGR